MNFGERAGGGRDIGRSHCRNGDLTTEHQVEYVQTLLEQLYQFVSGKDHKTLSYLIEMAHLEALYIRESAKGSKRFRNRADT